MMFSQQARGAIVQILAALTVSAARTLIYKHLGVKLHPSDTQSIWYIELVESASDDELRGLANEVVVSSQAVRTDAPTTDVFDSRVADLERWLLHDGWVAEDDALVRVTPSAEDVTGIRDRLQEDLAGSDLDKDGAVAQALEEAAAYFAAPTPDFGASMTKVRIALETTGRRAAAKVAARRNLPYPDDSWGRALQLLRAGGMLQSDEEAMLARVYTFISPGAHVPNGVTDEEWARLARTFGLSSLYFLLRKYLALGLAA